MRNITILFFLLFSFSFLSAQTYEPDKSFGEDGILNINCGGDNCYGYKIQNLNNGNFLSFSLYLKLAESEEEEDEQRFEIRKFDSNGNLDTSFADKGLYSKKANFAKSTVDFCLLPDERIVVQDLDNVESLNLIILDNNGKFEKTLSFDPFPNEILVPIKCLYKNGYLYIAGNYSFQDKLFILKSDLNGKVDSTFANNGVFILPQDITPHYFDDMEFQDSNVVIISTIESLNGDLYNRIFRIHSDGKPDSNFAGQGFLDFENIGYNYDLQIDNKNRIIISSFQETSITRLTSEGVPDISFGKSGIVNFKDDNITGHYFYSKILNDNSLLFFGSISNDEENPFGVPAILKLDENGKKDNSFGSFGLQFHNINTYGVNINGEIDLNNKILTTGAYTQNPDDDTFSMFLSRLKPISSSETNIIVGKELNIYPNPVNSDKITIQFPEKIENKSYIQIIDILGNCVCKMTIDRIAYNTDELTLNIPVDLINGQYLLLINSANDILSKKLIVLK